MTGGKQGSEIPRNVHVVSGLATAHNGGNKGMEAGVGAMMVSFKCVWRCVCVSLLGCFFVVDFL